MIKAQRELIRSLIGKYLQCAAFYHDDPHPVMSTATRRQAILLLKTELPQGFFDRRQNIVMVDGNPVYQNNFTGLCTYNLDVRLECLTKENAIDIIQVLRFGLWERATQTLMNNAGLAVQHVDNFIHIPNARVDTRVLCTATCEIHLTAAESYRMPDEQTIGEVLITNGVTG